MRGVPQTTTYVLTRVGDGRVLKLMPSMQADISSCVFEHHTPTNGQSVVYAGGTTVVSYGVICTCRVRHLNVQLMAQCVHRQQ
jgi:hypothetical protein